MAETTHEFKLKGRLVTVNIDQETTEPAEFQLDRKDVAEPEFQAATGWNFSQVVDAIIDGSMPDKADA